MHCSPHSSSCPIFHRASRLVHSVDERRSQLSNKVRSNGTRLSQTVQRDHRTVFSGLGRFGLRHSVLEVSNERIHNLYRQRLEGEANQKNERDFTCGWAISYRNCDMHCSRFLQSVQMPPLLPHRIANFEDIDPSPLLCPESDNRYRRVTEDVKFRNLGFDTLDDLPSSGDNILRRFLVTATGTNRGQSWCGEGRDITYFSPIYCMAAQAPAMSAPGLYEKSETSSAFLQVAYREPERLGLAYTPPIQTR